jgi:cephalosporin-C deacetylase-like acetyl esterase
MLLKHVAAKLNAFASFWNQQRERIRIAEDIEKRNRYVRAKFKEMIHGYPERTPLTPKTTTVHERDGYRIENVMFQSRPDFWVTGNLYIPTKGAGPYPGVISPCGHYSLSRMEATYQAVYVDLAKAGFVVLGYDPVGQGERRQYWNPEADQTDVLAFSTYEHSMAGQLLLLAGEDLTHYRVWDGIRAIDYLETRREVDANRIGCAGHSGGGTLSLFISALDERVKCSVVNEGGTSSRWPIEVRPGSRLGPSDVEQNYFPGAKLGVDSPDLHIAIAPRPLLAMIEDYRPGFNRAAEQIWLRYTQLGVAERFSTEEATDPHAWTSKLRLATTKFFCRWLLQSSGPDQEPDFTPEAPKTLYCTPNGSLKYSHIGNNIFDVIAAKGASLPPPSDLPPAQLNASLAKLLRYRNSDAPLAERLIVRTPRHRYSIEKLEFLSEPGIYIPTWVFVPEKKEPSYSTWLMFNEAGKQADGMEFDLYERLAQRGQMVIAADVRGIGETKPAHPPAGDSPREFRHLFDVETAIAYLTWYADESLLGMRVQDVIRTVDYALARPDVDRHRFRLVGKGAGALWLLFAAALDDRISDLTLEHGLLTYQTLMRADRYLHGAGIFLPEILRHFDLPRIAAALAGRNLTLVNPVDHMKRTVSLEATRQAYSAAEAAFRLKGGGRFRILSNAGEAYEAS